MWKSSNSWLCYLCVESYICEFCVCVRLLSLCGKTVTPSFFLSKILWCDLSDTPFALRVNVNRVVCFWLVQDLSRGANRGQPFSHHVLLMRLCCWPNLTFSQLIWEICDNVIIIDFCMQAKLNHWWYFVFVTSDYLFYYHLLIYLCHGELHLWSFCILTSAWNPWEWAFIRFVNMIYPKEKLFRSN